MKSSRKLQQLSVHAGYWLAVYLTLWALLSDASGWGFGLAFALAATLLSLWLTLPTCGLRFFYLPRFLVFFVFETALGAWDVARRALHPQLPLSPAWVIYPLRSPSPRVHLLLSAMVGLMPGTLASHVDNDNLYLHVLDKEQDWRAAVTRMEAHLAQLLEGDYL
ncbi:Na+/H+ antiporter subunit E [Cellvibrio sp. ARAG 10.3]|uniref:Na+/H+ antiporter subunit E n=1 Tax=Cellvibrio sp. ARAG 10.3 TaxID=3451358 RepID=UPI003F462331